jgi:hypothetical protein
MELLPKEEAEWKIEHCEGIDEYRGGRAWLSFNLSHTMAGHPVHIYALRVKDDEKGYQIAYASGFSDEVEALQKISDGRLNAMPLPGLEGDWIILAMSYGD